MRVPQAEERRPRRAATVLALAFFVVSAGGYLLWARLADGLWFMIDLDVYRWGGSVARHADNLYEVKYSGFLSFTYPPFAAALFVPLASLPNELLRYAAIISGLVLVLWTVWFTLGALGHPAGRSRLTAAAALAAVFVWLEPVQQTLQFGQINLLIMAILLADLLRDDARRSKGVGVGLVAGLKLTPLIFVVYLLLSGRVRATRTALITFGATIVAGAVALPPEAKDFWLDRLFMDSERVGGVAFVSNQSLHGMLTRLAGGVDAAEPWWLASAVVVGAAGMGCAVWASRRDLEVAGVLLCALTGLLVSPISWSHHWVWLVPGLTGAAHLAYRHRSRARGLLALGVTLLALAWLSRDRAGAPLMPRGVIWFAPSAADREYHWSRWQVLYENLYVVGGVALLAWSCLALLRHARAMALTGAAPTEPAPTEPAPTEMAHAETAHADPAFSAGTVLPD